MTRISLEQALHHSDSLSTPFELDLGTAGILRVEALLRILPGKRLVMKATQGDTVYLVKFFRQKRSYQKEVNGYNALDAANIATPKRLKHGELSIGAFCCYEYVDDLQLFKQVIEQAPDDEKSQRLQELLLLLRAMYKGRIAQEDLHFGNFAYGGGALLALDPASCRTFHQQSKINENLSLLLAQLPLQAWPSALEDIHQVFPERDLTGLELYAAARWKKRLRIFLKKIYRECTYVKCWSKKLGAMQRLDISCVRQDCTISMKEALETITSPRPGTEYLKRGESSLVYTLEVDGHKRAVKNSRNKTLGRLLRRCLRRSRASNAWYFSHLMLEAGIHTPQPLALVERKLGPLVLESWFVSDYVEADTLLDAWRSEEPAEWQQAAIKNLFAVMHKLRISHGDLKATNLLVNDQKILVIDYDGAKQHRFKRTAEKHLQEDRERFLQNWPKQNIAALLD